MFPFDKGRPADSLPGARTIAVAVLLAAWASQIEPDAITGPRRGEAVIADARHLAIYLAHVTLGHDLTRLAAAFGRDRASLRHALRRIEDRRDDPAFDRFVGSLEAILLPLRSGVDSATGALS
jgi:hypothetical protein